ncbi:MAG: glycosyltransferase [Planctomycetota bacterium]
MIFVTVGAQMAFDRLVEAVDEWAGATGRGDVFAQIGPTDLEPRHVPFERFLEPPAFRAKAEAATVIVAHAGMGSILTALTMGTPILVMPRRGDLRETRNDHQVATARRLGEMGRVAVAMDEAELRRRLDAIDELADGGRIGAHAEDALLRAIRAEILGRT